MRDYKTRPTASPRHVPRY